MTKQKKAASIKKELIILATYPFSDPSPVPEFGRSYPYNRFDGYSQVGYDQQWEMVVLENEYIKLWVNPAVGGKIWGAIEKQTGKEFIYFNHTAKFRDVATRGPWTSGGMEFNFGIIGHAPTCSSPVHYAMRENADGSVSCFISATDWPSRTNWVIEIALEPGAAYFTTNTTYYNNSALEQSYYQWNNVGVRTSGNLEYINPGFKRIGHDGKAQNWPTDEQGREISFYDKNNFGEYKSYHLFGSDSDFWGGYWHDDDFGFGHYAAYDDKPGKKIWIWGLSPFGMIWEDLLTDADGQYCEVQSGRLFSQSISQATKTPFKHRSFSPYITDSWKEYWFPVKQTDGLTSGNPYFSFNLKKDVDSWLIYLCANRDLDHEVKIISGDSVLFNQVLELQAMQNITLSLPNLNTGELKIWVKDELVYDAAEQTQQLSRPHSIMPGYDFTSAQAIYIQAKEWERQRFYELAIEQYNACLAKGPFYIDALTGLAGLYIRQTKYTDALALLLKALSVDTYHHEGNYLYGIVNVRLNNLADAKDGFSIATQSINSRSAAYLELAKLFFRQGQLSKAKSYTQKALNYNTKNRQAAHLELVIERLQGDATRASELIEELLQQNPLDHLIHFERLQSGIINTADFQNSFNSELPYETYLELTSFYFDLGLYHDCLQILSLAPEYALISIWRAYLNDLQGNEDVCSQQIEIAITQQADFVFPHREEDVKVLEWAVNYNPSWKLKYYLALIYTQMLRKQEALTLLDACKDESDFYVFYLVRANLKKNKAGYEADLYQALLFAPNEWRVTLTISKYLEDKHRWYEARDIIQKAYLKNPENYYLGLQLAKCLMHTANLDEGITLMSRLKVLPNEGALDGRNVWRETHLHTALQAMGNNWQKALKHIDEARQWPESMGVGKPYEVDERLEDFIELYCLQKSGRPANNSLLTAIAYYRDKDIDTPYSSNDFLSIYLLLQNGEFGKAQQILDSWKTANPDDLAFKWTVAFFDQNTQQLDILSSLTPAKREAMPYEILFEDRAFPFVKTLYQKGIFEHQKTNAEQH